MHPGQQFGAHRRPRLAGEYRKQWDRLKDAEAVTPDTLEEFNSEPRKRTIGPGDVMLWITPTFGHVDLAEAREAIDKAERAILFSMFNLGPRGMLLFRAAGRPGGGVNTPPGPHWSSTRFSHSVGEIGVNGVAL